MPQQAATQAMATKPWPGFGYVQVPGLANRIIARYLRGQRKTMRRFFADRNLTQFVLRMDSIRKSSGSMMLKNRQFQEVLDDYAKFATGGATLQPATEANAVVSGGRVVVQPEPASELGSSEAGAGHDGGGAVSDASVPVVAEEAGDTAGAVIEE